MRCVQKRIINDVTANRLTTRAIRRRLVLVLLVLFGAACQGPEPEPPASPKPAAAAENDDVVGTAAGQPILRRDIEQAVALRLHDLDMQRYRLLRQSLEIAALEKLEESDELHIAAVNLEPPMPPRMTVTIDPVRTRGAVDAPVTVLAFCNFESPHCARLQMTLAQVLPLFDGVVQYATRDFALPFHRNAGSAAMAAHCALAQGNYWRFHDTLFAGSGPLDRNRIQNAARSAQLDVETFNRCLESQRYAPALAADAEAAQELGLDAVPGVFVNGLYAGNSVDASTLVWLIDVELARLAVASPRAAPPKWESTAPLLLQTVLHSPHAGQGLAMLSPSISPERSGGFREGDAIGHALIVKRITETGVELLHNGEPEWLSFGSGRIPNDSLDDAIIDETQAMMRPHNAVPVTLDRNEVLVRLADRIGLEEVLETVPMKSGDYHQLRISEVRPGSLYELLGLQQGDVLLGVNEQPVHEAENPLWDALEREGEVRVRVMRRGGLAQHYTYQFDD